MKLYYATTKSYPATTADHIYIRELSRGFVAAGADFSLIVNKTASDLSGIPTVELNTTGSKTWAFLRWLLKTRPSADCAFMANDFNILSILVLGKKILRFKYTICSEWHLMTDTWKDALVAKNSDVLVTTSERLKHIISTKFPVVGGKIHTVYGAVDTDIFKSIAAKSKADIRKELNLPDGFLVGYVGLFKTMGMDKGVDTMIESAAFATGDMKYVFVGGSETEIAEYRALADKKGVLDRVLFVPRQNYERVALYERVLDVLVIPYPNQPHFADYGFPMKVYEYLASGTSIVYSNLAIIDEVLKGKGVSFEAGNAGSLAEALGRSRASKPWTGDVAIYSWKSKASTLLEIISKHGNSVRG